MFQVKVTTLKGDEFTDKYTSEAKAFEFAGKVFSNGFYIAGKVAPTGTLAPYQTSKISNAGNVYIPVHNIASVEVVPFVEKVKAPAKKKPAAKKAKAGK